MQGFTKKKALMDSFSHISFYPFPQKKKKILHPSSQLGAYDIYSQHSQHSQHSPPKTWIPRRFFPPKIWRIPASPGSGFELPGDPSVQPGTRAGPPLRHWRPRAAGAGLLRGPGRRAWMKGGDLGSPRILPVVN